jgi:pyruvate/oxaloacetate carboxyltransferase
MSDTEFTKLLKRGARVAEQYMAVQSELTKAFQERYGVTYAEVDCDTLIDILDCSGTANPINSRVADKHMKECDAPRIKQQEPQR